MENRLLEVKNLKVSFKVGKKKLTAVEDIEFSLDKGKENRQPLPPIQRRSNTNP